MYEYGIELMEQVYDGGESKSTMKKQVCKQWSKACPKKGWKNPVLKAEFLQKWVDEPFKKLSDKDQQIEDLKATMASAGLGGQIYGRDDIDAMLQENEL